jgi:predicted amidohydrolase YtcJ
LISVHAAVNHPNPAKRVSVQEALELYTTHAARIGFTESDTGSLEVGKLGDLVILGDDPFHVNPGRINDIPVEMTVIGDDIAHPQ